MTCLDNFEDRCFKRSIRIEGFIRGLKKSLQEPSSAPFFEGISNNPREPEAGANRISGKYDVTIRSAAVKWWAHLEPVFSNGGRKYRVFRVRKLYVCSV